MDPNGFFCRDSATCSFWYKEQTSVASLCSKCMTSRCTYRPGKSLRDPQIWVRKRGPCATGKQQRRTKNKQPPPPTTTQQTTNKQPKTTTNHTPPPLQPPLAPRNKHRTCGMINLQCCDVCRLKSKGSRGDLRRRIWNQPGCLLRVVLPPFP